MTGSPLANKVEEYHAMVNWIAPGFLSDLKSFKQEFAIPIHEGLQISSSAAQRRKMFARLTAIKKMVAPKVDRKTLGVLKNSIPTKTEFVIVMPLTDLQRKAYELLIKHQRGDLLDSSTSNTTIFKWLNVLALLCAHPKCFKHWLPEEDGQTGSIQTNQERTDSAEEDADDATINVNRDAEDASVNVDCKPGLVSKERTLLKSMDSGSQDSILAWKTEIFLSIVRESLACGDSVLVFSRSIPTLDHLQNTLNLERIGHDRLDGKTKMRLRQDMVKNFNKARSKVFLISTTAGGLGLNITGANRVIIFDFKFNPQEEQQAIGRSYRIGQTKPVFVYRLICGGTFEEKMLDRVVFKTQLAQRVVDKKNPISKAREFAEFLDMPTDPPVKDVEKVRGLDRVLDAILDSTRLRAGIRSVTTMDIFEEEEVEVTEVSAEDQAEADQLLRMHLVPSSAQVVGPVQGPQLSHIQTTSLSEGRVDITRSSPPATATPIEGGSTTVTAPIPSPPLPASAASVASQSPGSSHLQANGQHVPAGSAVPLAPIAGASTSTREPGSADYYLSQHRSFRGELKRAFTQAGPPPVRPAEAEQRANTANKIADLVAQKESDVEAPEQIKMLRNVILEAACDERFVQAICGGIVSPEALVTMNPASITRLREQWRQMVASQWETLLAEPQVNRADPQHFPARLDRMRSVPDGSASTQKPYHLSDRAAMEAVMARRTNGSSTPQTNGQRFKPLPGWATTAIQDAPKRRSSLAPPPSSAPPQGAPANPSSSVPPPPASQQARKAKNPFLSD
ncbi:P-loop containing nucleoside triphosphate hydrolase protein [Microdochium trichocladiopsis]|uniref:P-loop containing nucleoside triphosphate hydrolase protein n=1 Tax=Microdochium trichocladiopsis TaxID=1682393 RepID=A0A9P8YHT8_9PEZI|nr:P-loop containing nucleoside triphosphate hydrolase protein [Microdochium trichocladiopsis]KAH7038214.1 P-loop containing nucleoside triphosphate hydrolase protein [Microdochium trichocladiopsis]